MSTKVRSSHSPVQKSDWQRINDSSVNILFFSHYFPPEGNAPASRTYEHCLRWANAGHDVTVITCAPNVPDGRVYEGYRNRFWPQKENVDGINVIRVWSWVRPAPRKIDLVLNYLSYLISAVITSLFAGKPDVVISTSPQFFCGWAGVIASWLKWKPLVLEIRDIWPESIVAVGAMRRGLRTKVLESLERIMYRSARHIVTVGRGYRENIESKIGKSDRISVLMNGVDPEKFQPTGKSNSFQEKWELTDRFVCSYVGTVGLASGLDVTIRAAKRLKAQGRDDIAILVVGDGARRRELQSLAHKEGVDDIVVFTGRVDRSSVPEVLGNSDCCLVHLSGKELFTTVIPSKIFETMAMCRPIIMGVKGYAREIVECAGAGFPMEPDDDEDLANRLIHLADNPIEAIEKGQQAREFVIRYFNRNELADQYLQLLQAVVGGKRVTVSDHQWDDPEVTVVNAGTIH